MAILTVNVYKINGEYFPEGCERELSCGKISSIKTGVSLELPSPPLTCDEDLPEPVITEIIQTANGDKWWIEFDGTSFINKCIAASPTGNYEVTLTEDGEIEIPDALIMAIGIKPIGGNEVVNIGTTPGGTELVNAAAVTDGIESIQTVGYKSNVPSSLLYVTGITVPTTIKLYKI